MDETLNPSGTLSNVRGYGRWINADVVSVGQGNAVGGGKTLQVGQACLTENNNQVLQVGNRSYTNANNCYLLGSDMLNKYQYTLLAGQGHDTTNGRVGVSAVGRWSAIVSDTLFAVGNGTNDSSRSNAFEIKADGRVKASGTPTEADDLATKAYVDSQSRGGGSISVTTYGNAEEPKAVKYGRVVNMCGAFKNINVRPGTGTFVMGKVPAGCEPLYRQSILVQGTSQAKFLLTIETDGTLKCARYSTGASALAVPNNAWLNINTTYVSAS